MAARLVQNQAAVEAASGQAGQTTAALGAERLYLLSNSKSAAAIHLYEKLGFVHDTGIMDEFGARYERCNVAMLYPLD